jgi:polyisoprenyl-teichoic acid--peptidoglycan teichoic acid transferase
MALLPLSVAVWALSIVVPVMIEAREAMDEIFVTPVDRPHLDGAQPSPPQLPTSVAESPQSSPTTAGEPSVTPEPGTTAEPDPTPTIEATSPAEATPNPDVPTATPFPSWDGTDPVNILLLGVDSRPSDDYPPRSDTMIVVRVDPGENRVDIFSIPRDLLVEIPGYLATKVNAAYVYGELDGVPGGGPILAAQTIEYNFGIRVDYFATVDITGMERVVDTIGGVIIDVPTALKDDQYPTDDYQFTRIYFGSGPQEMDGVSAVQYSRTRHDDNDFRRSIRQQEVLIAIRNKILATGIITRLPELIADVGDAVRTDLSPRQVLSLARFGQDLPRESIYVHSINDLLEEAYIDEEFFFVADWFSVRSLVQNLPDNPDASNTPGQ